LKGFTAVVRISGAGRIEDFRERLRWLMVRDAEAEDYIEHHAEGVLEYRFAPRKGIPFPAFAEASGAYPELRVEALWEHDGVRGRAVIENGKVVEEEKTEANMPGIFVEAGDAGLLKLAFTTKKTGQGWVGYAATADRHTYFRYTAGRLTLVDPQEPDEALEDIAFRFVEEWIWYDEQDAAIERVRYAAYGFPVRGANLRSEKLAALRRQEGGRYSTLAAEAAGVREALAAEWLKRT
jgi:hypothetical protein